MKTMRFLRQAVLAALLVHMPAVAQAAAFDCTTIGAATDCSTTPCAWNSPNSWASCNGTYPDNNQGGGANTYTATIAAGHTVILATDGHTIGTTTAGVDTLTLNGTLMFSPSSSGRDAQGFRTLTLLPDIGNAGLTMGTSAVLDIPASNRLFGDTTAWAMVNRLAGTVDFHGTVTQTALTAVAAKTTSALCDAGPTESMYVVVTVERGQEVAKVGRRIRFGSGKFRNRQFEIASVSGKNIGFCTYLPDAAPSVDTTCDAAVTRSCGQRLTPHVTVGKFPDATPTANRRHWTPAPEPANAICAAAFDPMTFCTGANAGTGFAIYPSAGDSVDIIDDVWLGDASAAQNGVRWTNTGSTKMPHVYAVNIFGGNSFEISTHSVSATPRDVEYVNWHDPSSASDSAGSFAITGFQNYAVRYSVFHDDGSGAAGAYGTLSPACYGDATPPCPNNVQVTDNHFYRSLGNNLNFMSANVSISATGAYIARNLVSEGCSRPDGPGSGECRGLEVNNCKGCTIIDNVIYDLITVDDANGATRPQGNCIRSSGAAGSPSTSADGMAVVYNWCVNAGHHGIYLDTINGFAGQGTGVTGNYVSNTGLSSDYAGNLYGNVFRNASLKGTTSAISHAKSARGNFLIGNDAAQSATCAGSCTSIGFHVPTADLYMGNHPAITYSDNVITRLNHAGGAAMDTGAAYNGTLTIAHQSIYNGYAGIRLNNLAGGSTAIVNMTDIVFSHLNGEPQVLCSASAGVTDSLGHYMANRGPTTAENAGSNHGTCSPSGTSVTPNAGVGFVNPDGYDFNLIPDAAALTGAADGSALGVRAFRFNRDRFDALWGGGLPWDRSAGDPTGATITPFPKNFANGATSNEDRDLDGVMDFLDSCASVFNPSQFDLDADGFGDACDCASGDASVWDRPGETSGLVLTRDPRAEGSRTRLNWTAPSIGGLAASMTYDVIRSPKASDFVSSATCLASGLSGTMAIDPEMPSPGSVWFYVVRARDTCGAGVLHVGSNGLPRPARGCQPAPPTNPNPSGRVIKR